MVRTNFFKSALASMFVVCATAFYSCNSDEGEPKTPPTDESSIIGKWEVTDGGNTRAAGDTKYGSFEFTEDNRYIITQPTMISGEKVILIISGEYTPSQSADNNFTLNLSDFGTIKISIDANRASITIDNVTYVAVKSKPVELSENNKKLIGTWNVKTEDSDGLIASGTMTFTSAGTFLINYINSETPDELDYMGGTWSWSTGNVITIEYTSYEYSDIVTTPGKPVEDPKVTVIQEKETLTLKELTDSKFIFTITIVEEGYPDEIVTMTGTKSK